MCKPFVLACNYALDKLSEIEVQGLPPFELGNQIAFVHNSDQSMELTTHWRDAQANSISCSFNGTSSENGYPLAHTTGLSSTTLNPTWGIVVF